MITAAALCLSLAVYYESRNQPDAGQYAVAEVIENRVNSPKFPNDYCSVVNEDRGPKSWDCQFSFMCDGLPENPINEVAWTKAISIALDVMENDTNKAFGATYFATKNVNTRWTREFDLVVTIGDHNFYVE